MLAELAAANAAFAVIKAALKNGKELVEVGGKVSEYFDLKDKLQHGANEKAGGRPCMAAPTSRNSWPWKNSGTRNPSSKKR